MDVPELQCTRAAAVSGCETTAEQTLHCRICEVGLNAVIARVQTADVVKIRTREWQTDDPDLSLTREECSADCSGWKEEELPHCRIC